MKEKEIQKKISEIKALVDHPELHDDLNKLSNKLASNGNYKNIGAWQRVEIARNPDRPNCLEYIEKISSSFVELHGDRVFADDPAMVGGIATIDDVHFTFIGHQKGRTMKENLRRNYGWAHPEGYRKAMRLAKQAEKFGRPILTLIDTAGAYPGIGSEERGISEAIARNLKEFSVLRTPIIAVIMGEGGSGGAIGIGVGDRVLMMENSTYSVISPEGFASILLRDPSKAQLAAELMKMTSVELKGFGIIDGIIPEPLGGSQADPGQAALNLKKAIMDAYKELSKKKIDVLLKERSIKFLSHGAYHEPNKKKDNWIKRLFN